MAVEPPEPIPFPEALPPPAPVAPPAGFGPPELGVPAAPAPPPAAAPAWSESLEQEAIFATRPGATTVQIVRFMNRFRVELNAFGAA
jgi:hypothetical protein